MVNVKNYAVGRDRESRIVDGQCSELCKGGDRESITVYDQCSELCKKYKQRKQNGLLSMLQNYAKGRDRTRESRIDYDQCSELSKGSIRESRTDYGQCTMQTAETENAEQVMVNALCKWQRQRTEQIMVNPLCKGQRQRKQDSL